MPHRTIMHVDLDAFFVSVEQALHPELKGKPVVVGGNPGRRGVVATASYEAREYGLYSGMPLISASRLCPDAIFIEGKYSIYREFSERFMLILADYTPFIEPGGIDEAYLDVTGFESLHGSICQMAESLKRRIQVELGLVASVGISCCKVVAKVASDNSKPDGLVEVNYGSEASFLAPMPVEKLPGIGRQTLKILHNIGIHCIGELAEAPLAIVKGNLGKNGEILRDHAHGIDNSRVSAPGATRSISREMTFPEDIKKVSFLAAALWSLCERVGAALRRKRKNAKSVTIKVRFADYSVITRRQKLPESIDSDRAIFQAGNELLESALAKGKMMVRLVGIGVSGLVEVSLQSQLFDFSDGKTDKLNRAVDNIRNRYGYEALWNGRVMSLREEIACTPGKIHMQSNDKHFTSNRYKRHY